MTLEQSGLAALRLDLAGARGFDAPGAGPVRREAIGAVTREWLVAIWDDAMCGRPRRASPSPPWAAWPAATPGR